MEKNKKKKAFKATANKKKQEVAPEIKAPEQSSVESAVSEIVEEVVTSELIVPDKAATPETTVPETVEEVATHEPTEKRPPSKPIKREVQTFSAVLERAELEPEGKPDNWLQKFWKNPYLTKTISKKWSAVILVATLLISIGTTYFIFDRTVWISSEEKKIAERIAYYKEQVSKNPNEANKRVELGFAYFNKKDYDNAIEQYEKAISLDKNYYPAYLNLAIAYDRLGKTNLCLENATKAVTMAPLDFKGHLYKAISYRKLEKYDQALIALQNADRLSKGNMDILLESARLAEAEGKYNEAKKIYENVLVYNPTSEIALRGVERMEAKLEKK